MLQIENFESTISSLPEGHALAFWVPRIGHAKIPEVGVWQNYKEAPEAFSFRDAMYCSFLPWRAFMTSDGSSFCLIEVRKVFEAAMGMCSAHEYRVLKFLDRGDFHKQVLARALEGYDRSVEEFMPEFNRKVGQNHRAPRFNQACREALGLPDSYKFVPANKV